MKTENFFFKDSVSKRITNAQGRFSNQFMRDDATSVRSSGKRTAEESVRMDGYEVSARRPVMTSRIGIQQPTGRHSENWLG